MSKYIIGALAALAILFSVYQWGHSVGVDSVKLKNANTTEKQTGEARVVEQSVITKQTDLDKVYQKGALDAQKSTQALVSSLLNGDVRMYVPAVQPAATVPSAPAATCKRDDRAAFQLPRKTAADLAQLAADANANTDQLRTCQRLLDTYQELMPKWAAKQSSHLLTK